MTQGYADLSLRTNDSQWEKTQSSVQLHHQIIWFSLSTEPIMWIGHRREFVSWASFRVCRSYNTPNQRCTTISFDFSTLTPLPPNPGLIQLRRRSISCISSLVSSFFEVWGRGTIYWLSHKESDNIYFGVELQAHEFSTDCLELSGPDRFNLFSLNI